MTEAKYRSQEFGERLRRAIAAAGYKTVQGFAIEKKYPQAPMYLWINGDRAPRAQIIERLAADLNVSPGWLLFGEGGGIMSTAAPAAVAGSLVPAGSAGSRGSLRRPLAKVSGPPVRVALARAI